MSRRQKKPATRPEEASQEDTGTLLIRGRDSMAQFDRQLASSREVAGEVRQKMARATAGTPSARARRGRSA